MITRRRYIPTRGDNLRKVESLDYSRGLNTHTANDVAPENQLRYATDTRISTLGRQVMRKGADFLSVPAGEALDASQTSTTGAADKTFGLISYQAAKFAATATKRLTKVELNLKSGGTGPVIIEVRADNSGSPGDLLATSSIAASAFTGSYAYMGCRFTEAPLLTSGTSYWITAHIQDNGSGSYNWSSTTTATTAKTSADSGVTWSSTSYALNVKVYLSTDGATLGHFRATKSDGTVKTLLAYKESGGTTAVATVSDIDGSLTNIKTGLSASATRYVFAQANDVIYYVNGFDAPRKWDFTTEAAMGGTPGIATDIVLHVNRLFFVAATDPTRVFFTGVAAFETFTSTDFVYIPTPKTNDWITAMISFNNRNLVFLTRNMSDGKWVLSGTDISSMTLNRAMGTKGCASRDSVQKTLNFLIFASDDGVYRWNGSTDTLMSSDITNDYLALTNRDDMGSALHKNRYYLFCTPSGGSVNSQCYVFNLTYQSVESLDLATYVQRCNSWTGPQDSGQMVMGSNLVAALYYNELDSNDYSNLGRPLSWEIRTKYEHYGSPSQEKEIGYWYPRFLTSGSKVVVGYDLDFQDSPTEQTISTLTTGHIFGDGLIFGSGELFGGSSAPVRPELSIPGTPYYIQYRYSRTAVSDSVEFIGHTADYFVIPL